MIFCLVLIVHLCTFYHIVAEEASSPLILTPYLDKNDIETARTLSKVTPDIGGVTSYAGYFTVNKTCNSNLFMWFFPAKKDWLAAPVILWLQGGPGSSSMYGLFELVGPFNSFPSGIQARNYSWNNLSNLLFIDNPVGAGFSFSSGGSGCYADSIDVVVEGLYSALTQFFQLFSELKNNKLFLTGESFAGHYIPPLAVKIHKMIEQNSTSMNLKGTVIGNPLLKLDCHDYGSYLYQLGIADRKLRDNLYRYQFRLKLNVLFKNYSAAYDNWDYILNNLIGDNTDIPSRYNILTENPDPSNYFDYVVTPAVRDQINVGNVNYSDTNWDAYFSLSHTIAQPFSSSVEELLKTRKYIVGFYSGQLDIICMYTSTVCILNGLRWYGSKDYLSADRKIWYQNDQVVGWFKTADNLLLDILIKDAGHSAPYYKPEATYIMIESIISAPPGTNPLWKLKTSD
ncbi:venom serine carboxypeptidase-like [Homalodisca vitripennis]|uniref:venom serine carboxypeptidase-like n=1 Tax=Homalodisca vitripennis TaxID=197043 RepID=UPI001EE9C7C9|nr:venom serine carboxypeptidase-like [Homalodisca vitripennis]